jgi:hypothetical protein
MSSNPAAPTDKMDCRHFHALFGRKPAPFLVSCRPIRFEARRIDDPQIESRFAETRRAFNCGF